MNIRNTVPGFVLLAVLGGGVTSSAHADSFRRVIDSVTPVFKSSPFTVQPGQTITFQTLNLSAGGDTVIHLQDSNGAFLGGNDDCPGSGLASCATISNPAVARTIVAFVRGLGGSTGTAQLRVTRNGAVISTSASFTFGGRVLSTTGPAGAHVTTTLIQKELEDSIILLLNGTASAVAADDDSGAGFASAARAPAAFTQIVVGAFPTSALGAHGSVTVIEDDDVEVSDADGDGLGRALELAIGTNPNVADTDGDGIPDGKEVLGFKDEALPTWGANPLRKDLFVEADWNECVAANCNNPDMFRLTSSEVDALATTFWGPTSGAQPADDSRVSVHVDIGVANDKPPAGDPSLTRWGNWSGAFRRSPATLECDSLTPSRAGLFHLIVVTAGVGTAGEGSWCAMVTKDNRTPAHELGHNMSMGGHGGMPPTGSVNNNAVYPSIMNYSYEWHPTWGFFSPAQYRGVAYTPTAVDESNWKAAAPLADASLLDALGYKRSGNTVDWNNDGVLGGVTAGPVNYLGAAGRIRDIGYPDGLGPNLREPAMTWYHSAAGNRFYLFYLNSTDNTVRFRQSTNLGTSCAEPFTDFRKLVTTCVTFQPEKTVPGVRTTNGFAVVELVQASTHKLLIAFDEQNSGLIKFTLLTVDAGGLESWSATKVIDPSNAGIRGGLSGVRSATTNDVEIYGRTTSAWADPVMTRWTFNAETSTWSPRARQSYSDGSPVFTNADVGVTLGYTKGANNRIVFLAVPRGPDEVIKLAKQSSAANQWDLLPAPGVRSDVRPGIAYSAFGGASSFGRLFILARDVQAGFGNSPVIAFSEGNDTAATATSQRISSWKTGLYYFQEDQSENSGMALSRDLSLDQSVRGAFSSINSVWFQPHADGLVPFNGFRDQNDYDMMKTNIKCSLVGGCKWCSSLNADGTCGTWN